MATRARKRSDGRSKKSRYWSSDVTKNSNALDLEAGVFKRSPRQMAL